MPTQRIFTRNAAYQKFEVLKTNRNKRYRYGQFLVEGVRCVNGAASNGWEIVSLLYPGGRELTQWARNVLHSTRTELNYELTDELMDELSEKDESSELLAIVRMKDGAEPPLSDNPLLALSDRPANRGNLGTLFRSCDGFGADGLLITGHAADVYDPEVVHSSMGSFFKVPFLRLSGNAEIDAYLSSLRSRFPRIKIVGTTSHDKTPLERVDLTGPVLFLIGNESDGLNQHFTELCDVLATIPMSANSGASSFNVSCAASVMLYEATRQRRPLSVAAATSPPRGREEGTAR